MGEEEGGSGGKGDIREIYNTYICNYVYLHVIIYICSYD